MAKTGGGGSRLPLLLLLGLLCGLGGWNYHRNTQAAEQEPRPYRGYESRDLEALSEAYRKEIDTYRMRYEAATGAKVRIRDGGLIGDQIREFERVQHLSRTTRELGALISEREAAVRAIERERQIQEEEQDRLRLIVRRATSFEGVL